MFRRLSWIAAALVLLCVVKDPLSAQGGELTVEIGGSTIRPPAGVEGNAAHFLAAGVRASRHSAGGSGIFASVLAGRAMEDGSGGDFFSASVDGDHQFSRSHIDSAEPPRLHQVSPMLG